MHCSSIKALSLQQNNPGKAVNPRTMIVASFFIFLTLMFCFEINTATAGKQVKSSFYYSFLLILFVFMKIKGLHTFDGVVPYVLLIGLVLPLCMKALLLEASGQNLVVEPTTFVYLRHQSIGRLEQEHQAIKHSFMELSITLVTIHPSLIPLHLVQCVLLLTNQQQS